MGWFNKKKGSGEPKAESSSPAAPNDAAAAPRAEPDPVEVEHHAAMDRYWQSIGSVDSDVMTYVINPMFQGAPPWPNTRQAYRLVRTADSLIIASDGLSDPFPESPERPNRFGFGMETFIEVKGMQDATMDEMRGHWAFKAIESMAMNTASAGGFVPQLEQHGAVSIELPTDSGPKGWLKPNGMLGALIDIEMPDRANMVSDTPIAPVRIVPVTILHPAEIDICATGGEARLAMATDLTAQGSGHVTDPTRASLR